MSDPGRQQFLWPHPGLPRTEGEDDDDDVFKPQDFGLDKDSPVSDAFCLCYIDVAEVDYISLKSNHRRTYARPGNNEKVWTEAFVNP